MADLQEDLGTSMDLGPQHICAYQLTVEKGTPLWRHLGCGESQGALPEDALLGQMRAAWRTLSGNGWQRYEISNYARLGFECRHNLNYWRYGQYLGLGAGATSFFRTDVPTHQRTVFARRWTQARNLSAYLKGQFEIVDAEDIDLPAAMAEFCFLGLRTSEGVALNEFEQLFGISFDSVYGHQRAWLVADGLLGEEASRIRLTPRGLELSNQVFTSFIR
jgi:oxygen-independent coproporphyrinogen-3 oxidase